MNPKYFIAIWFIKGEQCDGKSPYKRNAFGNHSKGIINLNLKLNYEKFFAFYGLYN